VGENFEDIKRYEPGYPFASESACSFINNMKKIWGEKWKKLD